jgi:recombination protein RecT
MWGPIEGLLEHQPISPVAFKSAIVMAANDLRAQLGDEAMRDYRTQRSFIRSAMNAAHVGLIPGVALGHAHLVPVERHKGDSQRRHYEIQYWPGYTGFLALAYRANFLASVATEVVLTDEQVERGHNQDGPWIRHVIPVPREKPERQNLIGAYCTYKTRLGGASVVYLDPHDIARSDKRFNVWKTDYEAMVRKTTIRRAAKLWQQTSQLSAAITLDEAVELDRPQPSLHGEQEEPPTEIDLKDLEPTDEPLDQRGEAVHNGGSGDAPPG